ACCTRPTRGTCRACALPSCGRLRWCSCSRCGGWLCSPCSRPTRWTCSRCSTRERAQQVSWGMSVEVYDWGICVMFVGFVVGGGGGCGLDATLKVEKRENQWRGVLHTVLFFAAIYVATVLILGPVFGMAQEAAVFVFYSVFLLT